MKKVFSSSLKIRAIISSDSLPGAHFFNSSDFLDDKDFQVKGWQLIKEKSVAQIFFYVKNNVAISGYQSTFGSLDVEDEVTNDELSWFLNQLIGALRNEGVEKVKIKHYPSYFEKANQIENALINYGFVTYLTESNQHIPVKKLKFEEIANRSEVLRSTKCEQLGYEFRIASLTDLLQIYKLIEETLLRNDNKPSMSYNNLYNVIATCPDYYKLFTLWDNEKLIAATVSIKITEVTMYNFFHADHLQYRKVSSLTYLLKNIYVYCLDHHIKVLDLGISSVNGVLNQGLFNFKKTRGAVSSNKHYFSLTI